MRTHLRRDNHRARRSTLIVKIKYYFYRISTNLRSRKPSSPPPPLYPTISDIYKFSFSQKRQPTTTTTTNRMLFHAQSHTYSTATCPSLHKSPSLLSLSRCTVLHTTKGHVWKYILLFIIIQNCFDCLRAHSLAVGILTISHRKHSTLVRRFAVWFTWHLRAPI